MYYTLYQKRVYRVYQGGVYPDTADDPCPAALVAGYSDTLAIHRDTPACIDTVIQPIHDTSRYSIPLTGV